MTPLKSCRRFGHFDDRTNEYVITTPFTPRPWENRLWNDVLNVQISNHGTGIAYQRDNRGRFVLFNYRAPNRALYVRDALHNTLWCPHAYPVNTPLDAYDVRHGLQVTTFRASKDGIEVTWTVTVHPVDAAELWRVTVRNTRRQPASLQLAPFYQVDLSLSDPYFGAVNLYRSSVVPSANCLYIKNAAHIRKAENDALAFHADRPIRRYEMNLAGFLKKLGTLAAPRTVLDNDWSNSAIDDDQQPCFAAGFDLRLAPGATQTLNVAIFTADTCAEAARRSRGYDRADAMTRALEHHRAAGERLLAVNTIRTGDAAHDRFANVWIKHQLAYNALWNRGWNQGFRDAMSDCDMFRAFDPALVRARIVRAAAHIYADGHTVRAFDGIIEKPYFDGGVWFVNAVCQYVRETGDTTILRERMAYLKSTTTGTLLGHMQRTMRFLDRQRGPDGLCRMGFGDWNDALNGIDREGRGQSVWTTTAYIFALRQFSALLAHTRAADGDAYRLRADRLERLVNTQFFEGDRYVRAVTDAGRRIGTKRDTEGRIFIEPQGWALFSGVAGPRRAARIAAAVNRELRVPYGVLLMGPAYTSFRADVGRLANDAPGLVENGSVYVQGALFYAYGLAKAGMADASWDLLCRLLPSNPRNPAAVSTLEPFQITNSYQGPASRHPGRAMFAWRTGSAGWYLKTIWDGLLGIVPDYDGVRIDAHLPRAWGSRVTATRRIRGRDVTFVFARRANRGRFTLQVQNGALIPYTALPDGARVLVEIAGALVPS